MQFSVSMREYVSLHLRIAHITMRAEVQSTLEDGASPCVETIQ